MKKIIYIVTLILLLFSCKKENKNTIKNNASTDEYFEGNLIYNEHNFSDKTKTFTIGDNHRYISNKRTQKTGAIFYTATMLPVEYYIKKNLGIKNTDSLNYYKQKLKGEKVIQFEFQHKDRKDLLQSEFTSTDYKTSVEYMAFRIKNDFYAVTAKGDTIKCNGVLFERNFKLAPFKRILIYFKDTDDITSLKLIYNDNLFENGILKFNLIN